MDEIAGEIGNFGCSNATTSENPYIHFRSRFEQVGSCKLRAVSIRSGHIIDGIEFHYVKQQREHNHKLNGIYVLKNYDNETTGHLKIHFYDSVFSSGKTATIVFSKVEDFNDSQSFSAKVLPSVSGNAQEISLEVYSSTNSIVGRIDLIYRATYAQVDTIIVEGMNMCSGWMEPSSFESKLVFNGWMTLLHDTEVIDCHGSCISHTSGANLYTFVLEPNEYIIRIYARSSMNWCGIPVVTFLCFYTNKGTHFGPFGLETIQFDKEATIEANGSPLVYFEGGKDSRQDYYFGCLRAFYLPLWEHRKYFVYLRALCENAQQDVALKRKFEDTFVDEMDVGLNRYMNDNGEIVFQSKDDCKSFLLSLKYDPNSISYKMVVLKLLLLPEPLFRHVISFYI